MDTLQASVCLVCQGGLRIQFANSRIFGFQGFALQNVAWYNWAFQIRHIPIFSRKNESSGIPEVSQASVSTPTHFGKGKPKAKGRIENRLGRSNFIASNPLLPLPGFLQVKRAH